MSVVNAAPLVERSASRRPVPPRRDMERLRALYGALSGPLTSPLDVRRAREAQDPVRVAERRRLEEAFEADLDACTAQIDGLGDLVGAPTPDAAATADQVLAALRTMAARHRLHPVYRRVASQLGAEQVLEFLAHEGGPDHGFDDLVAACQVGLPARAKTELASNYWDEMGNGDPAENHTELYRRFTAALDMPAVETLYPEGLRRGLLMGFLAHRRDLQPEMIGALGMVELQAGPRCDRVLAGLRRVGLDADLEFYRVHADVDPVHGQNWLTNAVAPLVTDQPWLAEPILRGAAWRCAVDLAFFDRLDSLL